MTASNTPEPARDHHLTWNGTEWVDDRCGCRYHPDDDNGSHGGAPHVHLCERHAASEPAPPTDGSTEDDDPSEWDHGQLLREVHELHREARLYSETLAALRDRVRVLTDLLREERNKFILEDGACPECGALASTLGLDCETCEHVRTIDRALATTQEPPAKEPTP